MIIAVFLGLFFLMVVICGMIASIEDDKKLEDMEQEKYIKEYMDKWKEKNNGR